MKQTLCILLSVSILIAGCAGREANPVRIHQVGDETKNCEQLKAEMFQIESDIEVLLPKSDKTGRNIALGATGIIFIVPLFFMDLKQGEKKEIEAFQKRYNYLMRLYNEKGCASFLNDNTETPRSNKVQDSIPNSEDSTVQSTESEIIRTQCPHCKATFNVKREYLERRTKCQKCEQIFTIEEWAPVLVN